MLPFDHDALRTQRATDFKALSKRIRIRRHAHLPLVLYELEHVFKPAIFTAKILRDVKTATVSSLRVPLSILALVLAAELPWPRVSQLTVDIFDHNVNDTQPFKFGEGARRFRWQPLDCLQSLSQSFPALSVLVLSLHCGDTTTTTTIIDGLEVERNLLESGNPGLSEMRIEASR
ncbi:hypothetical protein AURDEDRAFT_171241 [Auricularia subglabra TFB-10046 SS5]|uniref:Uncharacterized protein n=1 Tax=Auricularia subglabra (strain TFB-10046 / SS5) TaxID=717982 RepID=J0WXS4_AURST|nr:hypothetical protein AURDEDRAFT_171241 [Auricularia subglabra TFB-10046 SS5]